MRPPRSKQSETWGGNSGPHSIRRRRKPQSDLRMLFRGLAKRAQVGKVNRGRDKVDVRCNLDLRRTTREHLRKSRRGPAGFENARLRNNDVQRHESDQGAKRHRTEYSASRKAN